MNRLRPLMCGLVVLALLVLTACGTIPRDPDGTLERVRSEGVLRVGASDGAERVEVHVEQGEREAQVRGAEADLVAGFAEQIGAEVEWTIGGETELMHAMQRGELDVIVGGLHSDSPWADVVSLTRPYAESTDPEGTTVQHVLAVPLGENGILVELERYLDGVTE